MKFDFGNLEDYVKESSSNVQSAFTGNRKTIRDMVERRTKEMKEVCMNDGNVYTWVLDFSDAFDSFLSPLDDEKKAVVLEMYAEELEASAAYINQQTDQLISKLENAEIKGPVLHKWVLSVALLFFLVLVLGMF